VAADEGVELEYARIDVGNVSVAEEDDAQAAAGAIEKCRPIALDLTIQQDIEPDPVPVEPQALIDVLDDDNGMMDRTRIGSRYQRGTKVDEGRNCESDDSPT
jgi:hypothetical protein